MRPGQEAARRTDVRAVSDHRRREQPRLPWTSGAAATLNSVVAPPRPGRPAGAYTGGDQRPDVLRGDTPLLADLRPFKLAAVDHRHDGLTVDKQQSGDLRSAEKQGPSLGLMKAERRWHVRIIARALRQPRTMPS